MPYYDGPYRIRLNRYGTTREERIQGTREKQFESYLQNSIYRTQFVYQEDMYSGVLEPYKQDETQTKAYLLTKRDLVMPNGTIITPRNGKDEYWMVWWLENMEASGYNRYIMLKMTHRITGKDFDGKQYTQWAYFHGPGKQAIKDEIKSRASIGHALYAENNNLYMFITYTNKNIAKNDYFHIDIQGIKQSYRVTDVDIVTTPGVEYVSVDPYYIVDETAAPVRHETDKDEDFYWLNKGGQG